MASESRTTVAVALGVNVPITITKITAGVIGGSAGRRVGGDAGRGRTFCVRYRQ
jgi:hypothetical protein